MEQIFIFDEPIFFTNSNRDYADYKKIIRFQANNCCRHKFNKEYILHALNTFTHGLS